MMIWEPVQSSNIAEIGHDAESLTCSVRFHSGEEWRYAGVTTERYEAFRQAESKGKHFHAHIRGKHEATKQERKAA